MFTKGFFVTLDGVLHKRCNGCCEMKPFTPEYYHRDASAPRGLHSRCIECRKHQRTAQDRYASWLWKQRNPERVRAYFRSYNAKRIAAKKRAAYERILRG